jgi:hypothetical protein
MVASMSMVYIAFCNKWFLTCRPAERGPVPDDSGQELESEEGGTRQAQGGFSSH